MRRPAYASRYGARIQRRVKDPIGVAGAAEKIDHNWSKRRAGWIVLLLLGALSAPLAPPDLAIAQPQPGGIPSSLRSRATIARVTPKLQRELTAQGLTFGAPIFIRIFKESSELELWVENGATFQLFRTYDVCAFSGNLGPKLKVGDRQAPEGFYFVTPQRLNPYSRFHLSFNLGYPNRYDRQRGRTGGALMVHGRCVSIGCFAMTNPSIEEIYTLADAALRSGQPFFRVHIFPFRMTKPQLLLHHFSEWREFWENLAEGYAYFEENGQPPSVDVREGEYVFGPP